jgi:hypothetical protein
VPFPRARAVGERFDVSIHTASRIVQQLAAQGHDRPAGVRPSPAVVFEHSHGTYGADDEPLEAVINIKPADGAVPTSETDEGD